MAKKKGGSYRIKFLMIITYLCAGLIPLFLFTAVVFKTTENYFIEEKKKELDNEIAEKEEVIKKVEKREKLRVSKAKMNNLHQKTKMATINNENSKQSKLTHNTSNSEIEGKHGEASMPIGEVHTIQLEQVSPPSRAALPFPHFTNSAPNIKVMAACVLRHGRLPPS